ncbi:hypothetical protein ACFIQG_21760 [Comamonas odontotermitis]|uniref:hypothetical protein n=1 Tax=Comamonas odontotermitis TaxID=379895 RepID=UPI00366FF4EE
MKFQKGFTSVQGAVTLVLSTLAIAGVVGWIWNIVKIINTGFDVFTGLLIARVVGVFLAPLGAVLGYL